MTTTFARCVVKTITIWFKGSIKGSIKGTPVLLQEYYMSTTGVLQEYYIMRKYSDLITVLELTELFSTPRFDNTDGEVSCIESLLMPIAGINVDDFGNLWIQQGESSTMFSCHTDTVHKRTETGSYLLDFDGSTLRRKGGGVLGADCGTGWLIMLAMLRAGVPGLYVWHRAEEIGGKGSEFFRANQRDLLKGIDRCVAFDRAGYSDVITHQGFVRGASDVFAAALCKALAPVSERTGRPLWAPCDEGVFTDSANYMDIIPECTNISVGYFNQHTQQEYQDLAFLVALIEQCCIIDWEQLPTERDPSVYEDLYGCNADPYYVSDYELMEYEAMEDAVRQYPQVIVELLMRAGYDLEMLCDAIDKH